MSPPPLTPIAGSYRSPLTASRGRGRPRTDIHARVVARYRRGELPADIARRLKVTKQRVSALLKVAGIDVRADKRADQAARVKVVWREWEKTPNVKAVAGRLGLTVSQVWVCYTTLRRGESK